MLSADKETDAQPHNVITTFGSAANKKKKKKTQSQATATIVVIIFLMHDPQRLLDQQKVMFNQLCPVLDISNLLRFFCKLRRSIHQEQKGCTFSFPRALSAMPPHCLVVFASWLVLLRSCLDWLSKAPALLWMVEIRSRSSRSTEEPSCCSSRFRILRASSNKG
jgi:hypothetical protein